MVKKGLIQLFLLVIVCFGGFSQNKYYVKFIPAHKEFIKRQVKLDSVFIQRESSQYLNFLHSQGYLLATIDSFYFHHDTVDIRVSFNELFKLAWLNPGNVDGHIQSKIGYKTKLFENKPFDYFEIGHLEEKLIFYSENSGYPFASVALDSLSFIGTELSGSFNYDPGPTISFDSIEIIGTTKAKTKFLQRYLRIIPGELFDQRKLGMVNREIARLPYLQQDQPSSIIFRDNKARVLLYLKDRPSNYIDGIVGILPNEGNSKKVLFTGEANILLQNLFGTGKKVKAEWKKYNEQSQLLDLFYFHPVILGSSLNLSLNFNLLKQDSTFMNIERGIKLGQGISRFGQLSLFTSIKTARNLGVSTVGISLPDFDYFQYGISYDFDNLDNLFIPKRGWQLSLTVATGNKLIRNLPQTGEDNLVSNKSSVQYTASGVVEKFFSIRKHSTFLTKVHGGTVLNNKKAIFTQDLFRVGGLSTLRGFNEKYFYAQHYLATTIEYRFFLDPSSYLLFFADQGVINNSLNTAIGTDYPTGFGTGVSFTTGPGIFTFIYSVGRSKDQPIAFNLSKIHFGFTSKF